MDPNQIDLSADRAVELVSRPTDIVLQEAKVSPGAPEEHGVVTEGPDQTYHAEAAVEIEILEDGRQRATFLLGDAELAIVYNREDQSSAERAAVLLISAPNMLTEVEEVFDAQGEEAGE
jgi:hypothetical protein